MTKTQDTLDAKRARKINKHAKALLALLAEETPGHEPFNVTGFVHELLATFHMIAAIWSVEDVQTNRPDLTDEQAWEVLEQAERKLDAEQGVTWETLESMAEFLFGEAPESDDAGEE